MVEPEDVEYVSRERRAELSVEELKTLLREQNALLREFGPSMREFVAAVREGRGRRKGLGEHLGEAFREGLVGGKFDGLIDEVRGMIRTAAQPPRANPIARRRRR